jgi:hypothetical protein
MTAKSEEVYNITLDIEDKTILEFLACQKKNTRNAYTSYFRKLKEFTAESGASMLRNHKIWERKIFAYQEFLRSQKYSPNYIESNCGAVRGFFSFYRKPLVLTSIERRKLRQRTRTTEDYEFSSEDIAKMYLCGSTKMRYLIAFSKCSGLRSEDAVKIRYSQLRAIDFSGEAPYYVGAIPTSKEGINAYVFGDEDFEKATLDLLAVSQDKKDEGEVITSDPNDLSKLIRRLFHKANLDAHGKRVRFHCFRKFLYDNLNMCVSVDKAKQIIGKATSESAYLSPNTLREAYSLVMPKIAFNGNNLKTEVKELKAEKEALKAQIAQLKEQLKNVKDGEKTTYEDLDARLKIQEFETQQLRKKEGEKNDD